MLLKAPSIVGSSGRGVLAASLCRKCWSLQGTNDRLRLRPSHVEAFTNNADALTRGVATTCSAAAGSGDRSNSPASTSVDGDEQSGLPYTGRTGLTSSLQEQPMGRPRAGGGSGGSAGLSGGSGGEGSLPRGELGGPSRSDLDGIGGGQPAAPAAVGEEAGEEEPAPSLGVRAALSLLAFYRGVLSPLMPSSCRFLPSCSVYSIESYKKFGVTRGTVLTAWRILRCNPWGGRGYDPPAWPPVGLGALYELPYTPELTLVLGAAAAYWLVASMVESLVR